METNPRPELGCRAKGKNNELQIFVIHILILLKNSVYRLRSFQATTLELSTSLFAYTYEFNNGSLKSSVPGTSCIIWI
jgi:hypothetical protein